MDKINMFCEGNMKLDSHIQKDTQKEKDVELENTNNKTDNKIILSGD